MCEAATGILSFNLSHNQSAQWVPSPLLCRFYTEVQEESDLLKVALSLSYLHTVLLTWHPSKPTSHFCTLVLLAFGEFLLFPAHSHRKALHVPFPMSEMLFPHTPHNRFTPFRRLQIMALPSSDKALLTPPLDKTPIFSALITVPFAMSHFICVIQGQPLYLRIYKVPEN